MDFYQFYHLKNNTNSVKNFFIVHDSYLLDFFLNVFSFYFNKVEGFLVTFGQITYNSISKIFSMMCEKIFSLRIVTERIFVIKRNHD